MRWPGCRVIPVSVHDEVPWSVKVFEAICLLDGVEAASWFAGANGAHKTQIKSGTRQQRTAAFMRVSILVWALIYWSKMDDSWQAGMERAARAEGKERLRTDYRREVRPCGLQCSSVFSEHGVQEKKQETIAKADRGDPFCYRGGAPYRPAAGRAGKAPRRTGVQGIHSSPWYFFQASQDRI